MSEAELEQLRARLTRVDDRDELVAIAQRLCDELERAHERIGVLEQPRAS